MALELWDYIALLTYELMLFAAFWFLLGGLDELMVDLIWLKNHFRQRAPIASDNNKEPGKVRFAVFLAAWQEAEVIATTLRHMLEQWRHDDVQIFLGCYANDPDTQKAARAIGDDPRLTIVINPHHGPTSKAQCLNRLWQAMCDAERDDGRSFDAVVLHDAEDFVHHEELKTYAQQLRDHDLVQLPVIPLIDASSPWVSGHYADEFAEAHGKALVVRNHIGAGLPLAGVGCAIARKQLDRLALHSNGHPFSEDSMTEDYELGLLLKDAGARQVFCRKRAADGSWVATQAYFPNRWHDAVRQKSRWIAGIALHGWDRLGWRQGVIENWMRLRDRRALLSALVLTAGYGAMVLSVILVSAISAGFHTPAQLSPGLQILLVANMLLLFWRIGMRMLFTARLYGMKQGLIAAPRLLVANAITIMATFRALSIYCKMLLGRPFFWEKTRHYALASKAPEFAAPEIKSNG